MLVLESMSSRIHLKKVATKRVRFRSRVIVCFFFPPLTGPPPERYSSLTPFGKRARSLYRSEIVDHASSVQSAQKSRRYILYDGVFEQRSCQIRGVVFLAKRDAALLVKNVS